MIYRQLLQKSWMVVAALLFTAIYSSFYITHNDIFNSPDETAHYFFIQEFAEHTRLSVPASIEGQLGEMVTPRSIRVIDSEFVPVSFLGLIVLYGTIVKLFGLSLLWLFMGALAVIGAVGFFIIVKEVWGRRIARFSFVLMLFTPAWWYYATLGLFPNVLLVTLLIWSVVGYIKFQYHSFMPWLIFSAMFTALALITRLAALPWILLLWLIIFFVVLKNNKLSFKYQIIWLSVVALLFIPQLLVNNMLYESSFSTGYVVSSDNQSGDSLLNLFPAGWHPRTAILNFWQYYIKMFWFISLPTLIGIFYFFIRFKKEGNRRKIYFLISAVIVAWLVNYYGSWHLTDNINKDEVSLGVSYVRYWLPVYLLSIPIAVYGAEALVGRLFARRLFRFYAIGFLVLVFFLVSFKLTYFAKSDSLSKVHNILETNKKIKERVISNTEPEAVIISYRHDKVFFPNRSVIHTLNDKAIFDRLPSLLVVRPVYLYTFLDENDFEILLKNSLLDRGIKLQLVSNFGFNKLYKLSNEN